MPSRTRKAKRHFSIERALYLLIGLGFGLTGLSEFFSGVWPLELLSHFSTQYVLIGSLLLPIMAWRRAWGYVAAVALVTLLHAIQIWPYLHTTQTSARAFDDDSTVRIMFANVHYQMTDFDALLTSIYAYDPEIIMLAEVQELQFAEVANRLKKTYRYARHAGGVSAYDFSMLSKDEPTHFAVEYFVPDNPSMYAVFDVGGVQFGILGIHAFSPMSEEYADWRDENIRLAVEYLGEQNVPVILVGDFNITQFSPTYQSIFEDSALYDTQQQFGLQPSWPTHLPVLMRIPIDHILVSAGLSVERRFLGLPTGSDHLPVLVDIVME